MSITQSTKLFVQLVRISLWMLRTRIRNTQCQCQVTLRKLSRRKYAADVNACPYHEHCLLATITLNVLDDSTPNFGYTK